MQGLRSRDAAIRHQAALASEELRALEEARTREGARLQELTLGVQTQDAALAALRTRLGDAQCEVRTLQSLQAELEGQQQRLRAEAEALGAELARTRKEAAAATTQLQLHTQRLGTERQSLAGLRASVETAGAEQSLLRAKGEAVQREAEVLARQAKEERAALGALWTRMRQVRDAAAAATERAWAQLGGVAGARGAGPLSDALAAAAVAAVAAGAQNGTDPVEALPLALDTLLQGLQQGLGEVQRARALGQQLAQALAEAEVEQAREAAAQQAREHARAQELERQRRMAVVTAGDAAAVMSAQATAPPALVSASAAGAMQPLSTGKRSRDGELRVSPKQIAPGGGPSKDLAAAPTAETAATGADSEYGFHADSDIADLDAFEECGLNDTQRAIAPPAAPPSSRGPFSKPRATAPTRARSLPSSRKAAVAHPPHPSRRGHSSHTDGPDVSSRDRTENDRDLDRFLESFDAADAVFLRDGADHHRVETEEAATPGVAVQYSASTSATSTAATATTLLERRRAAKKPRTGKALRNRSASPFPLSSATSAATSETGKLSSTEGMGASAFLASPGSVGSGASDLRDAELFAPLLPAPNAQGQHTEVHVSSRTDGNAVGKRRGSSFDPPAGAETAASVRRPRRGSLPPRTSRGTSSAGPVGMSPAAGPDSNDIASNSAAITAATALNSGPAASSTTHLGNGMPATRFDHPLFRMQQPAATSAAADWSKVRALPGHTAAPLGRSAKQDGSAGSASAGSEGSFLGYLSTPPVTNHSSEAEEDDDGANASQSLLIDDEHATADASDMFSPITRRRATEEPDSAVKDTQWWIEQKQQPELHDTQEDESDDLLLAGLFTALSPSTAPMVPRTTSHETHASRNSGIRKGRRTSFPPSSIGRNLSKGKGSDGTAPHVRRPSLFDTTSTARKPVLSKSWRNPAAGSPGEGMDALSTA
jgi:hypothetical protein